MQTLFIDGEEITKVELQGANESWGTSAEARQRV